MNLTQEDVERVTINGYEDVPENDDESLVKALAHQPVSVAIEASGRDFQFYKGVYIKQIILISKLCSMYPILLHSLKNRFGDFFLFTGSV